MKAKYYIYRNLNKGGFSIKYKGKVIYNSDNIKALRVQFKVSQKGRERVIKQGVKNVHAYAVCEYINLKNISKAQIKGRRNIWYNPFKTNSFRIGKEGKLSINNAKTAYFTSGKCYI